MSDYIYPFSKVKQTFDNVNDCSIGQFVNSLMEAFGGQLSGTQFATIPLKEQYRLPMPLDDMTMNPTITWLTNRLVSAFLLTSDRDAVFGWFSAWAEETKDAFMIDTVKTLISRINGDDDTSLISAAHLAYYEAHACRFRPLEDNPIILPSTAECVVLRYLTHQTVRVMRAEGVQFRPSFDGAYGSVVAWGTVDFISHNTIWGLGWFGKPAQWQILYLLVSYLLARKSTQHKDKPLQFIRILNIADGVIYSADIKSVNPNVLRIIDDCLNGPDFPDPTITTLDRSQQRRLVTAMVRLLDIKHQGKEAITRELAQLCVSHAGHTNLKPLQDSVTRHFMSRWPADQTATLFRKVVILLNRLFYYVDNPAAPEGLLVALGEEAIMNILKKALEY